ncbi:MAG: D-2-hydroxyacid dehydrogenase [Firmicutes bacterium]|nr:D-2-hydroxyacid dehydrogenase [Bacillota bacterium]
MTHRPNMLIAHGLGDKQVANITEIVPRANLRIKQGQEEVTLEDMAWAEIYFGWPPLELLKQAQQLVWVHLPSAGADGYADQEVYAHRGVILTNSSGVYGIPLAEHAFSMMLAFSRTLHKYVRFQQEKHWEKLPESGELYGKTLGILGLGDIGTEVAKRAKAFGMQVWGLKRRLTAKPDYIDQLVGPTGLPDLLAVSDYVVIALPLTAQTEKMVGKQELAYMQSHAILINVGRGPIIDQLALIKALQDGQLAGAGLDVFEEEPLPQDSPLWDMPNVIITPHSGGVTPEATRRSTDIFCHNLRLWLEGRKDEMKSVVDMQAGY